MTKIKYIHCFGTSYTAGGGFEFESTSEHRVNMLKKLYENINEDKSQYNFSYPGQLQKLVNSNVTVKNHGKQGYGNERLYRKVYDVINRDDFNPSENIFLFEFSDTGRKEMWSNDFDSYIIMNYGLDFSKKPPTITPHGLAKSYYYDTESDIRKLKNLQPLIYEYFKKTFNLKNTLELIDMNMSFLLSYLKQNNVTYYSVSYTSFLERFDINNKIVFGDGNVLKQNNDFVKFASNNKLFIIDETNGRYDDLHCGFIANKLIAKQIYNFLVNKNQILGNYIDIDWELYSNTKLNNLINSTLI